VISTKLPAIAQSSIREKANKYHPKKTVHRLTWVCLLLACIGTSWFAYQIFLIPQPRTFTPDWQQARWIEAADTSSDPAPIAYFRRSIYFGVVPDKAYITITANQVFRLYVNGIYIGSNRLDSVSGATPQTYIFDIDSTLSAGINNAGAGVNNAGAGINNAGVGANNAGSALVTGTNIIGVRVANADQGSGWQPVPSLLANISASWGNQKYNYGTDAVWQATDQAALAHPRMSLTDYDWTKPTFDATSWQGARVADQPLTYPPLMTNPQIYQQPMPVSWITAGAGQESYYVRNFSIPAGYDNALLRIVATGQADIFINDRLYTRWNGLPNVPQVNVTNYLTPNGQPAPYRNGLMLGIYNITPYLHPGSNTIAVHVMAPGATTAKIGLDTQRSAMTLEILAGNAGNYTNVVSSSEQWHASLHPVAGWTAEGGPAFAWASPELIGRPGSSQTFYLPDSNAIQSVQTLATEPLIEVIGISIIVVLACWFLFALALRRFMLSRRNSAGTRYSPYEKACLVFLPALALEALLLALSREPLITQPFPYTNLWGCVLIAIVLLTALFLLFHTHTTRGKYADDGFTPSRPLRASLPALPQTATLHTPTTTSQEPYLRTHPTIRQRLWLWSKHNWAIWPVILVTMPMVLYNPAYEPYWQDELDSYYAARYIMAHGFPAFPSGFIYPKAELFSYMLAFVMTIFGTHSLVVTRSISMIEFLISLPIFYLVGYKLFNRRVAWFAMTMLAFSPYAMVWSRMARMYEQAQFMVIIVVGVLYWAIQNRNKKRPIYLAILCILIAYFSHEEVFITFPALLICSLVASREGPYSFPSILKKKHWWIPALIAVAIISVQLSVVILSHPPTFGTDQSRRPEIALVADNVPYYFKLLFAPQMSPTRPIPMLGIDSMLAVLGCIIALIRKDRRACYCALFLLISVATLVFIFTMGAADRYFYPLLPIYYLMAAYGTWTVLHALWIFARPHLALPRIRSGQGERLTTPPSFAVRMLPPVLRIALGGTVALVIASILLVPMLPISNFNLFVSRTLGMQYHRHYTDYDDIGQYMHDHMRPGDTVISIAPAIIVLYQVGKVDDFFSADRSLFLFENNGRLVETSSGSHPLLNEADFQNVLAEHNRIWLITDGGGYQGVLTRNGRFVFPPPDFQLVYEAYASGIYFRSNTPCLAAAAVCNLPAPAYQSNGGIAPASSLQP
jgi:Dolichyl-phosphate-mannose-protein mannosyltransferase